MSRRRLTIVSSLFLFKILFVSVLILSLQTQSHAQTPCESLYAADIAERSRVECDEPIPVSALRKIEHRWWGCLPGDTPNQCAWRQYVNPNSLPNEQGNQEFELYYLPQCKDGTSHCPGEEIRCTDGTRPAVYFAPAHDSNHNPINSSQWIIIMSGEGDPCGGDIVDEQGNYSGKYNCWDRYFQRDEAKSLSSKLPEEMIGPHQFTSFVGVLENTDTFFNGFPNPWHGVNRVKFERCSSWSGDTDQLIHPTATPDDYPFQPATFPGETTVYHHGERIAKSLFKYIRSELGGAEATHVVLAGTSDATIGLTHAADELSGTIQSDSPGTWVGVALDGYFAPMFEGEASFNDNGDSTGSNLNPDSDTLYDHIGNPLGRHVPLPELTKDSIRQIQRLLVQQGIHLTLKEIANILLQPYSTAAYETGGQERLRIDRYGWDLDQSCEAAASHGPYLGNSACYDHQHVFINHLSTPLFLSPDMDDVLLQTISSFHGFFWTGLPSFLPDWSREDFNRRVQHQAITVAEHSPTPVGLFVTKRNIHTSLVNYNATRVACRDNNGTVDHLTTLAGALYDWMMSDGYVEPMIAEYSPAPGVTWHDEWDPVTGICADNR